ncbi:7-carboxy-7-deazaguanine synthase QueE [Leptolyngbya sp. FACHB-541]|uniref:7-carboxy-7-deazaguanine synthase QueE n=1 Tax=Leptolyngbya sp. FACHB-541 TaxID=2692810 RepID=UPI001683746A|nr:7-carboxy-7-deazaguanine synthase QueE [Leptolyngbya sp. FACHB-541]MBD1995193.1 7-carboxy-7-deazaguanine synthase QueE [Leptolyngbya sp. FACHB-541]
MSILFPIHETFQQTLQGEGFWAGTPVDFIRLSGCPVSCHFCDTGYADGGKDTPRTMRSLDELIAELKSPFVVISGGEPFIHSNLPELVKALEFNGKRVAIETSGAFWQELPESVWVTVSPKEHISPKYPVDERWWRRANEIKLVISSGQEVWFYRPKLAKTTCSIFLQPEWGDREKTLPLVMDLLQRYTNCRLSLQLHKFLGIQ